MLKTNRKNTTFGKFVFFGILAAHVLVLLKTIFFPYPELFIYPYLTNMGLVPYRDILDQHFPGLMFFPVNLGNLGMTTPYQARFVLIALVLITQVLIFLTAKKLFKSEKTALLASFLYLVWQPFFEGWVLWIDSFIPVFTLLSFYFLSGKKYFWSGIFIGIAILFKQVVLPLAALVGIYLLLKEKKVKPVLIFGLGVLIPVAYLIVYISKLNIWQDFVFWTITFNITTFAEMGRKYGTFGQWIRVAGVYGFSMLFLFDKEIRKELIAAGIFLAGSLASVYARFDYVHLQPSLPFAVLLSACVFSRLATKKGLKALIFVYFAASVFLTAQFFRSHVGDKIIFYEDTDKKVAAEVEKLSKPGEKIFALGAMPHIYSMAKRLPPGDIFVFQFPWFMIEAENRILSGIINDPPAVIIRDKASEVEGMRLVDYMSGISAYADANYKAVNKIDGIEILVKK